MGDFVSNAESSQATTNQQTAVQGGSGSTTAAGVRGAATGGAGVSNSGSLSLKDNASISVVSSDPATVKAALDSNTIVSTTAINDSAVDAEEAYAALENESNNAAQVNSQAITTSGIIANNSLANPNGNNQQVTSDGTTPGVSKFSTYIWIVLGILGLFVFFKSHGRST